jgi:LysM domain
VSSLAHHLTARAHGALPFHPGCPICRGERLSGTLPDAIVSQGVRAGLAAGVMALSGLAAPLALLVAPPVAAASEEDELAQLLKDLENVAVTPQEEGEIQGEQPIEGEGGPVPEGEPGAEAPEEGEPSGSVAPPPPAAHKPRGRVKRHQPLGGKPRAGKRRGDAGGRRAQSRRRARPVAGRAPARVAPRAPARVAPSVPTKAAAPVPAQVAASEGARVPTGATGDPARAAGARPSEPAPAIGREYVVRPGDSLWSIAGARLGQAATAPAIAREVERLWRLNAARIHTGRPDLIHAGDRLRLR